MNTLKPKQQKLSASNNAVVNKTQKPKPKNNPNQTKSKIHNLAHNPIVGDVNHPTKEDELNPNKAIVL